MELTYCASLRAYNTFGMDVRADVLASFADRHTLLQLLEHPHVKGKAHLILGGGSNVLFTRDYPGAVLLNRVMGIELLGEDRQHCYVKAGAGENWHSFVLHCIAQGWAGLENLTLIPGLVGASPMQNIGAYGVEIKDRFYELEAMHIESGRVEKFDRAACHFGYRESVFKRALKDQYVILTVSFALLKEPALHTGYGAIRDELSAMDISEPTMADVSRAVMRIRNSKLPNPAVLGNAGSFFKNPVVTQAVYERIAAQYGDLPHYPAEPGYVKLAAGWLIEHAGWKGRRIGACGVHEKQALVLVNYGGATGADIWNLSQQVLESVEQKYGVRLEREVNVI
jgi:UDP-N-acetylmuramate dehydrogenase